MRMINKFKPKSKRTDSRTKRHNKHQRLFRAISPMSKLVSDDEDIINSEINSKYWASTVEHSNFEHLIRSHLYTSIIYNFLIIVLVKNSIPPTQTISNDGYLFFKNRYLIGTPIGTKHKIVPIKYYFSNKNPLSPFGPTWIFIKIWINY
jgi:hypothetical protein